ncbi:exonuclease SbcC [Arthrobacter ulcerisalmonis]|uniref:AAA family ATPase n=1 Tax=Arthrobacter sp. B1I2 TaxID=3042263 RepID=UPI0027847064|nr:MULTISPECIES: SMC family ATPase [Arthrobacter]MDQ0663868.1 exonuclease SbcC [Arthrobacter ulcerisalmonis]MDQ0731753.1 exonuclease SbcC [Arthrobacter sp. B1I2]
MRIHHLRISAFGPFAGTEDIDFDRLSAHGLFLLNGPTGAGKTSVLDAICFALYGSVPGARQDGKRLRSDHAEPGLEPAVTCEFSSQGRRFEVTRSPAWDKPSARGKNGFTVQQAKTLLRERVNGAWVEKSARNDEAGAELMALLGMDREQFTRVVMLPQGDFAAFLRSKAADRLDLLQKLFGTQRFEALEQELSRQAAAAREDVAVLSGQLGLLASRAETEAAPLQLPDGGAPSPDDVPGRLKWLQASVAGRLAELTELATAAAAASQDRRTEVEREAARHERHRKLHAATARRTAVEEGAAQREELSARLARHRQAEVLQGQLQAMDAAAAKVHSAEAAAQSAMTLLRLAAGDDGELAQLGLETAEVAAAGPDVAEELGRLRSLQAVVEARLPDEDRLQDLRKRHHSLAGRQEDLQLAVETLGNRAAHLLAEREQLANGMDQLEARSVEAALRRKEAAAASELLDVVRRYGSAAKARDQARIRHEDSREYLLEAKRRWLDLREERLANAASELAAKLVPGEPCPVCGNGQHPGPASAGTGGPGLAQDEEEAHGVYEAAEAAHARVAADLAEAEQAVAVLAGQGGTTPLAEARTGADEAMTAAAAAEQAAEELQDRRQRLELLDAGIGQARHTLSETEAELSQTAVSLAELAEQAGSLDTALASLRGGHRSMNRRLRALADAVAVLDKAVEAQSRLDAARLRSAEAREHLELALPGAGFATADDVRGQLLGAADVAALEAAIRAAQDEAARVAGLFESEDIVLALAEAAEGFLADEERLAALRLAAAAAQNDAREADLAAGLAARCLASLKSIAAEYEELLCSSREPAERAQMLAGLADAAAGRGENTYRMSLNSYVLAARLEQVALAASERLVAMSDGRYLLQHTDAKAARGAKSGLGLEVVDQWTGFRRDTSTLSGGESFMASLSLALGLADVVQQEAGGVEIETLFVDEGFGSLDEQSLEQVMDALEGLRDGGRVVGLVSHVAEMKQRIGTQLQVLKSRNGSTLRISESLDALL